MIDVILQKMLLSVHILISNIFFSFLGLFKIYFMLKIFMCTITK